MSYQNKQIQTNTLGVTKVVIADNPTDLAAAVSLVASEARHALLPVLDINNPAHGNNFALLYANNPSKLK